MASVSEVLAQNVLDYKAAVMAEALSKSEMANAQAEKVAALLTRLGKSESTFSAHVALFKERAKLAGLLADFEKKRKASKALTIEVSKKGDEILAAITELRSGQKERMDARNLAQSQAGQAREAYQKVGQPIESQLRSAGYSEAEIKDFDAKAKAAQ